jgi:hypothetical protein
MLGLSSTKAGARMKETTLFGRAGGLHTQISTSAGGSKSIDETWWLGAQAASWCSDELISKCSFRTARLTRKPRTAACRRTTVCSCDDGHGVALEATSRCFLPTKGLYLAVCQEPSCCRLKPHRCLEFLLCLLLVAVEHHNELISLLCETAKTLFEPSECIWSWRRRVGGRCGD